MPTDWFGADVAATYDLDESRMFDPATLDATVGVLADLAGPGPALELAIGTGRVALPLAARGIPVVGIDLSEAMIARLRAKPGEDAATIPVTVGDIATTRVDDAGSFTLVYLVFNTITNLVTQDAQVECFRNAAHHLAPGGAFVVETFVPRLRWLPPGQRFVPFDVSERHIGIDEYDVAAQTLVSHHTTVQDGVVRRNATPFRYAWAAELDLMARLAGMRLRDRWSGWDRQPFTSESESHVSVWELDRG